jgi:LacI family transcriptional regulator
LVTRPSLQEVARRSGVSVATASRVLNPDNNHPVSQELRERVLASAAEYNYAVNALARGLKIRRTRTVAIIVHDIRDPYFNECARGIADAADPAGYLAVVCNSDRDPGRELRYVQLAYEQRVSGVLFVGSGFQDRGYRREMKRKVDALRDYGAHAVALSPRHDRLPAEVPDNVGGARSATEHLIGLGHERIAYINGPTGLITNEERLTGYRDALEAAGIAFDEDLVEDGNYSVAGGQSAAAALLDRRADFTAIFASNDTMGIGCMRELRRRGLAVPRAMSLVGFDDIPLVSWLDPPMTTVSVPMAQIGAAAMQRLTGLLADGSNSSRDGAERPRRRARLVNVHATALVVRGSTAAPETRA